MNFRSIAEMVYWVILSCLTLVLQISFPQIPVAWWVILLVSMEEHFSWLFLLIFWSGFSWVLSSFSSLPWFLWCLPVLMVLAAKPWIARRFLLGPILKRSFGLLSLSFVQFLSFEVWAVLRGGAGVFSMTNVIEVLTTYMVGMVLLTLSPELKFWLAQYLPKAKLSNPKSYFMSLGFRKKRSRANERKPFGLH